MWEWSQAPISWPIRRSVGKPTLIVTDELVRALQTESAKAIEAWWGVHHDAVRRWRRALKITTRTAGQQAQKAALDAARTGQPAHPATRAALLRAAKRPKAPGWGARAKQWMDAAKPPSDVPPLQAGPYATPKHRKGGWATDELLGRVQVFGTTEARIPWPRIRRKGPSTPVLTSDLARAIRAESAVAVSYWWGVSRDKVRRWRRELDVGRATPGTREALRRNVLDAEPPLQQQRLAALRTPAAKAASAEAAAARRGIEAHPRTKDALDRGRRKKRSPEWGQKANAWMQAGKRTSNRDCEP